jgi:hypothetical protein
MAHTPEGTAFIYHGTKLPRAAAHLKGQLAEKQCANVSQGPRATEPRFEPRLELPADWLRCGPTFWPDSDLDVRAAWRRRAGLAVRGAGEQQES